MNEELKKKYLAQVMEDYQKREQVRELPSEIKVPEKGTKLEQGWFYASGEKFSPKPDVFSAASAKIRKLQKEKKV